MPLKHCKIAGKQHIVFQSKWQTISFTGQLPSWSKPGGEIGFQNSICVHVPVDHGIKWTWKAVIESS
jgi:hypothetical protein